MKLVAGSERIVADEGSCPVEGVVRWAPAKSLWIGAMTLAAPARKVLRFKGKLGRF